MVCQMRKDCLKKKCKVHKKRKLDVAKHDLESEWALGRSPTGKCTLLTPKSLASVIKVFEDTGQGREKVKPGFSGFCKVIGSTEHREVCTSLFITSLLAITELRNQARYPSTEK